MTATLRVEGADGFARLAQALRAANRPLRRAVERAFGDVAPGLLRAMRAGGADAAPAGGGLAARVERAVMSHQVTDRGGDVHAELRLRMAEGYDLGELDAGRLHHPTFGRAPWVTQQIQPGGFSRPVRDATRDVDEALRRRVDAVLDEIGAAP
ncbi:hypothetical protein ACK8HX_02065 [Oryzobacter sp. R7]|uniref:hypothetical protein n=1 Tax=Oryzobacter faecalis TaxID=3388656 RepID=UPI00398D4B9D